MTHAVGWSTLYRVPDDLPSDTEESVVGTAWHQEAIGALADALRAEVWQRGLTWGVYEQVALKGLRHDDGTDYDPRPDVVVLPRPLPSGALSTIPLSESGIPLFIAEVASQSTWRRDLAAKQRAYEAIGVAAYLVFDPDGALLPQRLQGWLLVDGHFAPWRSESDGWWYCRSLEAAFRADPPFVAVRGRNGRVIPRSLQLRAQAEADRARADQLAEAHAAEQLRAERLARAHAAEQARADRLAQEVAAEQVRADRLAQEVAAEQARADRLAQEVAAALERLAALEAERQRHDEA